VSKDIDPHDLIQIYECINAGDKWDSALDTIVNRIGAQSAIMIAYEDRLLPFNLLKSSKYIRERFDKAKMYQEQFGHFDDQVVDFLKTKKEKIIYKDTDLWRDWDKFNHRSDVVWCQENFDFFRRCASKLNGNKAWFDALFVHFNKKNVKIDRSAFESMSFFLPHLAKAVEKSRFFSVLLERYNAVLTLLDRVNVGLAVLEPRGHAVVMNEEARRIVGEGDGIALGRDGRLVIGAENTFAAFKDAVEKASATAQGCGGVSERLVAIPRRSGNRPYLLGRRLIKPQAQADCGEFDHCQKV